MDGQVESREYVFEFGGGLDQRARWPRSIIWLMNR